MRVLCLFFPRLSVQLALRTRPELASRPVIMVSGAGDEALVASASTDAAARGVVPGMTPAQARVRCAAATFLPDNAGACLDELERIASILRRRATGIVAIASREELLIDLSTVPALGEDEADAASRIAGLIRMWSELSVRAGVASSRTEAREAARGARLAPVVRRPVLAWHEPAHFHGVSAGPLAVEVSFPPGTSPLAARARLERASRQLQSLLSGAARSFREARVTMRTPAGDAVTRFLMEPTSAVQEALTAIRPSLTDERLAGSHGVRLELDRLGPEVEIEPAVALRAAS